MAKWIVVMAVILSGWLLGSAEAWIYFFICVVVGVAVILWLFSVLMSPRPSVRSRSVVIGLALVAGFLVFQAAPIPERVLEKVSPLSLHLRQAAVETLTANGHRDLIKTGLAGFPGLPAVSVAPGATERAFCLFIAYAGVFLVLSNTVRSWGGAQRIALWLTVSGFAMALIAMAHKFSGSREIMWFNDPRYGGAIFGPFTNRNHFAACMNLYLGTALGLFLSSTHLREVMGWPEWRDRVAWLTTRRASGLALSAFAVMVMGGAVCLSVSRGGICSLLVMFALLALIGGHVAGKSNYAIKAGASVALIVAAVLWLGWEPIFARLSTLLDLAQDPLADSRSVTTRDTLHLFGASVFAGTGFGTFRYVFPIFQTQPLTDRYLHAHDDWAQMLAEGGVVGGGLFLVVCFCWVRLVVRGLPYQSSKAQLLCAGFVFGVATIALHSFVDYGLHKPGNAFLLAALAGLAVSPGCMGASRVAVPQKDPLEESLSDRAVAGPMLAQLRLPPLESSTWDEGQPAVESRPVQASIPAIPPSPPTISPSQPPAVSQSCNPTLLPSSRTLPQSRNPAIPQSCNPIFPPSSSPSLPQSLPQSLPPAIPQSRNLTPPSYSFLSTFASHLVLVIGILASSLLIMLELREFRGELAFARILYDDRMMSETDYLPHLRAAARSALDDSELVKDFARNNPDTMRESAEIFLRWLREPRLDRALRVNLAVQAAQLSAQAANAGPGDYLTWLSAARTHAMIGRWDEAESFLNRARMLIMPDQQVRMFGKQEYREGSDFF